jgi:transposase
LYCSWIAALKIAPQQICINSTKGKLMTKGKSKGMIEIRNIIHRLRSNESQRNIEKEADIHRSIVKNVYELAVVHHWLDPASPMPTDEEIAKVWKPSSKINKPHPLDLHRDYLEQWRKEGYSAVVMHQLLKNTYACDAQAIRRYLNKHFPRPIEPVMVRSTIPGQHLDIDFGYLGTFLNDDKILRKVWVFSFRLRHSRRTYRKIVLDQRINTFLTCHIHALEWFNGVAKYVVLDNCKAAILQCTVDNDMVRRSYQELAEYYGFIISPCLPRTPQHKGGVENDMKYVKGNFLPYFHARQKEKNITVSTIGDLAESLELWGKEVADTHVVHGIGRSPLEIFNSEELKALKPLPQRRWELTSWAQCTVRRDWRIMYDSMYYSVPYQLIEKEVQVCATESLIRIFYDHKEVAFHERGKKKWEYKRKAEYAPPYHEEVLQCSREGLIQLAEEIGYFTHQVAYTILSHHSVDKLRPVRCLLQLRNKYSQERLEKACQRAFHYKMFSYSSVKNILENNLEQKQIDTDAKNKVVQMPQYRFARDAADYKSGAIIDVPERETFLERLENIHSYSKHGTAMSGIYEGLMADQIMEEQW